ncbi:hypothetical protein DPEC_G00207470 [Dallia pectoralis]|uniref:Uncharacterized protein n=1 Tax=Dallia pectoralis TaxID=75939 RepID=A0ACC2G5F6_DALPE|nr:hypothetical protein DPEC_G00207470 [Dallia pectoralis]
MKKLLPSGYFGRYPVMPGDCGETCREHPKTMDNWRMKSTGNVPVPIFIPSEAVVQNCSRAVFSTPSSLSRSCAQDDLTSNQKSSKNKGFFLIKMTMQAWI